METDKSILAPGKEDYSSWKNSNAPSITVVFQSKRRMMWPIYLLGLVEYRPKNFDDADIEGSDLECLRMALGEELAIVYGHDLTQILNGLSEGQGCVLTEQGKRYIGLGKKGEPRIAKIEVKAIRDQKAAEEADSEAARKDGES
jgi:hypothetical protein